MNFEIRTATPDDLPDLSPLIDEFAQGHPAAKHPRPPDVSRRALFEDAHRPHLLLGFRGGECIGFTGWGMTPVGPARIRLGPRDSESAAGAAVPAPTG